MPQPVKLPYMLPECRTDLICTRRHPAKVDGVYEQSKPGQRLSLAPCLQTETRPTQMYLSKYTCLEPYSPPACPLPAASTPAQQGADTTGGTSSMG